jgi:hypothetical protein
MQVSKPNRELALPIFKIVWNLNWDPFRKIEPATADYKSARGKVNLAHCLIKNVTEGKSADSK